MIFPFHGIKSPSKLYQFMVSKVRSWSLPAGKRCRGKTHHAGVPSALSVPPKALPPAQLRGGCQVLLALLSPWVEELSRSGTRRTPLHSNIGVHRAVIRAQDSTHQESSKFTPDDTFLLEGDGGNIRALSPAASEQNPTGYSVSSTQPQH